MKNQKRACRWAAVLCLAALVLALLCGCRQQPEPEAPDERPVITIGVDDYAPFCYRAENGDYTGVDVELAREAFGRLGYQVEFKNIEWPQRDVLLADGTVDCLWDCYSMTGREEDYDWAGPYMNSRHAVAVRADSGIESLADLAGRSVAVQDTTRPEEIFLQREDPRIPALWKLYCCQDLEQVCALLRKGYADAVAAHEGVLDTLLLGEEEEYLILDEALDTAPLGVAFAKGAHTELAEQLGQTLDAMKQDGTLRTIAESYGLDPETAVWKGDAEWSTSSTPTGTCGGAARFWSLH